MTLGVNNPAATLSVVTMRFREHTALDGVTASFEQLFAGAGGDEHPDSSSLVEDPVGDQLVEPLGSGGGIDAVEGGQLVGGGRLGLLGEGAVDDRVLDLGGHLPKDRAGVLVHGGGRWAPGPSRSLGSLLM